MAMLRTITAFIVGTLVGGLVNMALVMVSPMVIPPPEGVDVNKAESLAASMHLFSARHFIFPFLAHALGTFVGALVGYLLAARYQTAVAGAIGGLFLCGGIAACFMIPAPAWFMAVDLAFAYVPMAGLAVVLGKRLQSRTKKTSA